MTPNLRLDQHCRMRTAFGQKFRDTQEYFRQNPHLTMTIEQIREEAVEKRSERELERIL